MAQGLPIKTYTIEQLQVRHGTDVYSINSWLANTPRRSRSIKRAYKHTRPGSPVRALCLQGGVNFVDFGEAELENLPHIFLAELARNYQDLHLDEDGAAVEYLGMSC